MNKGTESVRSILSNLNVAFGRRWSVTCVDFESVCIAGHEIAAEEGLSARISYYPLILLTASPPTDYDLVLQCNLSMFDAALSHKVWHTLAILQ